MNLWLISQRVNNQYNTFDSAVVAAETEEEAKMMHPSNGESIESRSSSAWSDWVGESEQVICEYIGEAKDETQKGVICASYNAG